jgi:hypothetical protein
MSKEHLIISFSGGRTSGYLTKMLIDAGGYKNIHVVFANTGQEHPKTLEFVNNCDKYFGFNTTWLEAEVKEGKGNGTRHRVVDFDTASRDGRPFEDVIRKYGIPFTKSPHCTREMKRYPIMSYVRSLGLKRACYDMAIGIRADEVDRMSPTATYDGIIYPLVKANIKKMDVLKWWSEQDFDLDIPEHMGNCTWCWKKSFKKLVTVMDEMPEAFEFPKSMEEKYARSGAVANKLGKDIKFFRGWKSVDDIGEMLRGGHGKFIDPWFEATNGCSDSCEVFTDDEQSAFDFMERQQ